MKSIIVKNVLKFKKFLRSYKFERNLRFKYIRFNMKTIKLPHKYKINAKFQI